MVLPVTVSPMHGHDIFFQRPESLVTVVTLVTLAITHWMRLIFLVTNRALQAVTRTGWAILVTPRWTRLSPVRAVTIRRIPLVTRKRLVNSAL